MKLAATTEKEFRINAENIDDDGKERIDNSVSTEYSDAYEFYPDTSI